MASEAHGSAYSQPVAITMSAATIAATEPIASPSTSRKAPRAAKPECSERMIRAAAPEPTSPITAATSIGPGSGMSHPSTAAAWRVFRAR